MPPSDAAAAAPPAEPALPDPAAAPRARAFWDALLDRSAGDFVEPEIAPAEPTAGDGSGRGRRGDDFLDAAGPSIASGQSTRLIDSRNWSGAVIENQVDPPFTWITATWTVPTLTTEGCLPDHTPLNWQCSAWIGLDGYDEWSASMPQIGTVHRLPKTPGGTQTNAFWYQWWVRNSDPPSAPFELKVPEVSQGDRVTCALRMLSPTKARAYFWNLTTGQKASLCFCRGPAGPLFTTLPRGSTADWIVERPTVPIGKLGDPAYLYPLPNFGKVEFTQCLVGYDVVPGRSIRDAVQPLSTRHLRMFERHGNPRRTIYLATGKQDTVFTSGSPHTLIRVDFTADQGLTRNLPTPAGA